MAVNLSPVGGVAAQFFDNNGVILSGGKIYTYAAGTTTNQTTYTSAAGTTAHTNPIILDSAGRVPSGEIWLTDGLQYKFVIKNASDVLIGTYDNIVGTSDNSALLAFEQTLAGVTGSSLVGFKSAGTGAEATTAQTKLRESISADDFIPAGTNTRTTDCGVYIQAALDYAESIGAKEVYLPQQFYKSTVGLKIPNTVVLRGNGVGAWDVIFPNRPKTWTGTTILFAGTGAKTNSFAGITDLKNTGGWRVWGTLASISAITSGGSGYVDGEAVTLTSATGVSATGTVAVTTGAVTAVTVVTNGDYFVNGDSVTITSSGGSGAKGTAVVTSTTTVKLSNWMNTDASGATKATAKTFSAAITNKELANDSTDTHAFQWGLKDLRIAPWIGTDGYSDYSSQVSTSLGDAWDVGLFSFNSEYEHIDNVQVVGYWREAGTLRVQAGYTVEGAGERGDYRCFQTQGYRGLVLRSSDVYPVTASTTTTVEIPWSESQYWTTTGLFEAPGGTDYTYSGLTYSAGKLTFTGVSPDATSLNGSTIRSVKRGTGVAGAKFDNALVSGLNHTSGLSDTALGFAAPGIGFEISGFPLRGYEFFDFKVQNTSIEPYNTFFGDCRDSLFFGCQFESGLVFAYPNNSAQNWVTYPGSVQTIDARFYGNVWSNITKNLFLPRIYFDEAEIFNPIETFASEDLTVTQPGKEKRIRKNTGLALEIQNGDGTNLLEISANSGNTVLKNGRQLSFEGSSTSYLNAASGQNFELRNGTTTRLINFGASGNWGAGADNTQSWGTSTSRWSVIYAGTGTINTSDAREKQGKRSLSDAERSVAVKIKSLLSAFKFNDAVEAKGENARTHFGVYAQDVIEAFASEGLDATKYALLCYDEWEDQYEDICKEVTVLDSEGGPTGETQRVPTGERILTVKAGNRYGVRYEELLAFIISTL